MPPKIELLTPRIYADEAVMGTDPSGRYTFADTATGLLDEITSLRRRVAELGERELDLQAEVSRLRDEACGPGEYKTWREAAIAERIRRVKAEKTLGDLEKRDVEACEIAARWIAPREKHDWTGFQQRVEKFLHINLPVPIPVSVWYSETHDDFFDSYDRGMGDAFYTKWHTRHKEFPKFNKNCPGTWP